MPSALPRAWVSEGVGEGALTSSSSPREPRSQRYPASISTPAVYSRNTVIAAFAILTAVVAVFIVLSFVLYMRGHHSLQGTQARSHLPSLHISIVHSHTSQSCLMRELAKSVVFESEPSFADANASVDPCEDFHAYACSTASRQPSVAFDLRLASLLNAEAPRMYELTLREKAESFYQSCVAGVPPPGGTRTWFSSFLAGVFSKGTPGGDLLKPLANLSLNFRLHLLLTFRCEQRCGRLVLEELDPGRWMEHSRWLRADQHTYAAFLLDAVREVGELAPESAVDHVKRLNALELMLEERFFMKPASITAGAERGYAINRLDLTSTRAVVSSGVVFGVLNFLSSLIPDSSDREAFLRWLVARNLHVVHFEPLKHGAGARVHCLRLCAAAMGPALVLPILTEMKAAVLRAKTVARQVAHAFAFRMHSRTAEAWLGVEGAEAASAAVTSLRLEVAGESLAVANGSSVDLESPVLRPGFPGGRLSDQLAEGGRGFVGECCRRPSLVHRPDGRPDTLLR
ncbi:hypothetical protein MTO96_035541 [Rhipicephalus appendiculatus]